jgi:hypothetical protein
MGSPPPPDAPPPEDQAIVQADISFPPSPTAADICGFKIPPSFSIHFALNIPFPNFSLPLPFNFSLALKCDLSDPLEAEVSFGGGKKSTGNASAEDRDY